MEVIERTRSDKAIERMDELIDGIKEKGRPHCEPNEKIENLSIIKEFDHASV